STRPTTARGRPRRRTATAARPAAKAARRTRSRLRPAAKAARRTRSRPRRRPPRAATSSTTFLYVERRECGPMVRPRRLLPVLAVLASVGVALAAPGPAAARTEHPGAPFRVVVVDRMSDATFRLLAQRGAVGLLRAGYGPTTNRRRALAELVRGAEVNARLGGVPGGRPLINTSKAAFFHGCRMCIVVKLPP